MPRGMDKNPSPDVTILTPRSSPVTEPHAGRTVRQLRRFGRLRRWTVEFTPLRCTWMIFGGLFEIDEDIRYVRAIRWRQETRKGLGAMP